jgi:uncharacterized protein YjbI with pentapeptide repeats
MNVRMTSTQLGETDQETNRNLDALNEASEHLGGLILSAVAVYTYVALAVASTSQEDLLVGKRLSLPLIETPIPLQYFYMAAPFLVLLLHGYVLLNQRLVFEKALQFGRTDTFFPQMQWHGFIALMMRTGFLGFLGRCFFYAIGVLAPLTVLLLLQFRFLPFRRWDVTLLQSTCILADATFVALISRWDGIKDRWAPVLIGSIFFFCSMALVFILWQVPDTDPEAVLSRLACLNLPGAHLVKNEPDGIKANEFGRQADALLRYGTGADLQGRNLSYAYLEGAILVNADLRKANFSGADLSNADFRRANLSDANFFGANLAGAQFDGSTGERVLFDNASLANAHLSGVMLRDCTFKDADLKKTEIHGSAFEGGSFDLANFYRSSILSTTFRETSFIGAQFSEAYVWGDFFLKTRFEFARFNQAHLQGSFLDLREVDANGASFDAAEMQFVEARNLVGVCLRGARIAPNVTHLGSPKLIDLRGVRTTALSVKWQEEVRRQRSNLLETLGTRDGDWFKEEFRRQEKSFKLRTRAACVFCERKVGQAICSGCVAFDKEGVKLGLVRKNDTPANVNEIQTSILRNALKRANSGDERQNTNTIRLALTRELRHCFSPSREPDWAANDWLNSELRKDMAEFWKEAGDTNDPNNACPWWQKPTKRVQRREELMRPSRDLPQL